MTKEETLLTILGEESNEILLRCNRAMRFGAKQIEQKQMFDNETRILIQLNNLFAATELLFDTDIKEIINREIIDRKKAKIGRFFNHIKEKE